MKQYGETTGGLSAYLHDLLLYPLLPPAEVVTLIRRAQRGDVAARNRVVEANLRLVVYVAKGYARSGLPLLDLIQAGNEGLLHAVQKFDAQRGVVFPCYALYWIRQRIQRLIDGDRGTIHIPGQVRVWVRKVYNAESALMERGVPLTDEAVCGAAGLSMEQLAQARAGALSTLSLETALAADEGDDSLTLSDLVSVKAPGVPLGDALYEALATLDTHERLVICWRFGLPQRDAAPMSSHDACATGSDDAELPEIMPIGVVARRLDLSSERVRQIERRALQRLRALLHDAA